MGPTSLPSNSLDPYDNEMELERYPCPYQRTVKELLCTYRNGNGDVEVGSVSSSSGIRPENVFVGVGSDEAIDLLIRIFCIPGATAGGGDAIMVTPPTYGMYNVCANVNDVAIQKVPLTPDFDVQIPEVRLSFTCSAYFKLMKPFNTFSFFVGCFSMILL